MVEYNSRQEEIIRAIASWKRPSKLCGRDQCLNICHILDGLANGTELQKSDLVLPGIQRFAANCELEGPWSGKTLHIFDILEALNDAAS